MASNRNDYDPNLAGDIVQTAEAKQRRQTSFDMTNSAQYLQRPAQPAPAAPTTQPGPVARATQQLAGQPIQSPVTAGAQPGIGGGQRPIYTGIGANGEKSFSSTPPSLNSIRADYPAPNNQSGQRLASPSATQVRPAAQAASQIPTRLEDAYPTGIGDGKRTIYAGVGANGEASFSTAPSSINSLTTNYSSPNIPQAQRMTSLSDAWQASPQAGQPPQAAASGRPATRPLTPADASSGQAAPAVRDDNNFASLGTVRNMGDGIGTFSQSNPGDSALAATRFQRANDERQQYLDNRRLNTAVARSASANNTNIIRDSSRPASLSDLRDQAQWNQHRKELAGSVQDAQGLIEARRGNATAGQQQRQANRLEDIMMAATAPGATPEQREAYRRLRDPDDSKALERQLTMAKIEGERARAKSQTAYAERQGSNSRKLSSTLQKVEDEELEVIGTTKTMNETLDGIDKQIEDGSLVLGPWQNVVSWGRNATGQSDQNSANYASFMTTLEKLRNDSLRLNKGTQTEGDAQRAWSELITNTRDPQIVRQRLKEIATLNMKAANLKGVVLNSRRASQNVDALDIDSALGGRADQRQVAPPPDDTGNQLAGQAQAYNVQNDEDYRRLPSGADFIDAQGNHRRKP